MYQVRAKAKSLLQQGCWVMEVFEPTSDFCKLLAIASHRKLLHSEQKIIKKTHQKLQKLTQDLTAFMAENHLYKNEFIFRSKDLVKFLHKQNQLLTAF